jgi:hypothetical protein
MKQTVEREREKRKREKGERKRKRVREWLTWSVESTCQSVTYRM